MRHEFHKTGFCIYCGLLRRRDAYTHRITEYQRDADRFLYLPKCSDDWPENWHPIVRARIWVIGGQQLAFDLTWTASLAKLPRST